MKRKKLSAKKTPVYFVSVSSVAGFLSAVIVMMVAAVILTKYDLPGEKVKYIWFLTAGISGLITGLFSGKISKSKSIIWGMISSALVSLIMCLVLFIFSGFSPELTILIVIPVYVITGFLGAVVSSNLRK